MGTLFRRGKVWYALYQDADRKWRRESTRQSKKALAQIELQRMEAEARYGERVTVGVRFADYVPEYWQDIERRKVKTPETIRNDRNVLDKWLLPYFGDRPLAAITERMVEEYQGFARSHGLRARTVNKHVGILAAILAHAVDDSPRRLAALPWRKVPKLKEDDSERGQTMTHDEVAALLECCEGKARLAVALMAYTGLRRGTVHALRWEQINFRERVIRIEPGQMKAKKAHDVYFGDELAAILNEQRGIAGPLFNCHVETIGDWVRDAMRHLDIHRPGLGCHAFRHAFITGRLRAGVDIETVRRLAGHSTVAMTARYAHTQEAIERAAVEGVSFRRDQGKSREQA